MGGSDHPSYIVLARKPQAYLRWRNANARHADVLAAQRRERAEGGNDRGLAGQHWEDRVYGRDVALPQVHPAGPASQPGPGRLGYPYPDAVWSAQEL
jgi:hypothetical protein